MTCVDSVCTALSSASRKVTAMTLPRRACALLSFSREPTPACCVQNSLRSCLLVRPEIPLSGPPLIVCRVRLTVAARRKNSSPENLTHLHYNLLGKDSSTDNRADAERDEGNWVEIAAERVLTLFAQFRPKWDVSSQAER